MEIEIKYLNLELYLMIILKTVKSLPVKQIRKNNLKLLVLLSINYLQFQLL